MEEDFVAETVAEGVVVVRPEVTLGVVGVVPLVGMGAEEEVC